MALDPERLVRIADLVPTSVVADRLAVTPRTVLAWSVRYPDFPPSIEASSTAHVWIWPDVEAWVAEHRPDR